MAKKHTVKHPGETFCSVAVTNGFKNCEKLRGLTYNKQTFDTSRGDARKKWVLKKGDKVEIPDIIAEDDQAQPERVNKYRRRGLPLTEIRFTRDTAEKPTNQAYRGKWQRELNISNFVTTKAGVDEKDDLVDESVRAEFDEKADKDDDIFKVEVVDPRTTADELDVHIEARKPKYAGTGEFHEVVAGAANMATIASTYDGFSWRTIYDHRLNRDFRTRNPNHNSLTVGDQLFIPKKVTGHEFFPGSVDDNGTERGKRSLKLKLERVKTPADPPDGEPENTRYFRSCYVRLVVDDVDKAARPKQTLLVTDCYNKDNKEDSAVEILDQNVWAEYPLNDCPGDPKCRVVCDVPINRGKEVDLAIHVLRPIKNSRGKACTSEGDANDNGVVKLEHARKRVQTYVRRIWAQAHVKFNIARLQTVDFPSDMITVGGKTGKVSVGYKDGEGSKPDAERVKGKIGFTIRVQRFAGSPAPTFTVDQPHPYVINPFDVGPGLTPEVTAALIKAKIDRLPNLSARVSVNPSFNRENNGSSDVFITDEHGGRITLSELTDPGSEQDMKQKIERDNFAFNQVTVEKSGPGNHVGAPSQRNLIKSLDTGDKIIDIHVCALSNTEGCGIGENSDWREELHPLHEMANSILVPPKAMNSSTFAYTKEVETLAHEIGHILLDDTVHEVGDIYETRLMYAACSTKGAVTDSKRITSYQPGTPNYQVMPLDNDGWLGFGAAGEWVPGHKKLNLVAESERQSADLMHWMSLRQ